ncbi:SH3 domain-containing protein [Helicobacter sp. T3_23-1056]
MKSFFKAYTLPFLVLVLGLVMYYVMFIKSNERYNQYSSRDYNAGFYGERSKESNKEDSNFISEFFASIKQIFLNSNPNQYPKEESQAHFTQSTTSQSQEISQNELSKSLQENLAQDSQNQHNLAQNNLSQERNLHENHTAQNPPTNDFTTDTNIATNTFSNTPANITTNTATNTPNNNTSTSQGITHYALTRVNVRKEPNMNAPVIGRLSSGESTKVIKINDEWAQLDNGGWVSVKLLTLQKESEISSRFSTQIQIYIASVNANIRQKPDNDATLVGSIFKGERVRVLSVANGWARLENGGYVAARLLSKDSE